MSDYSHVAVGTAEQLRAMANAIDSALDDDGQIVVHLMTRTGNKVTLVLIVEGSQAHLDMEQAYNAYQNEQSAPWN